MPRLLPLAAFVLASSAFAQPGPGSTIAQPRPGEPRVQAPHVARGELGRTDRDFIHDAAQSGLAEIAKGRLALQRTRDPRVRDYAQHLVQDHQEANARLAQIAQAKGVGLPTAPGARQQKALRDLQHASGREFDGRFLRQMVDDHQQAIDQFGHEVKGRHQAAELKEFAQQVLPKLEQHMAMAENLQKRRGHMPR